MIKVGEFKQWRRTETGKRRSVEYSYEDVKYDFDGWADAKKFIPEDFDLCDLKINGKSKSHPGWAIGSSFDGLNIKPEHEIVFWKKRKEPKEGRYASSKR